MTQPNKKRKVRTEIIKFRNPIMYSYTPWVESVEYHHKIYPNVPEGCKIKHVEIRNYAKSDFFRIRFAYLESKKDD